MPGLEGAILPESSRKKTSIAGRSAYPSITKSHHGRLFLETISVGVTRSSALDLVDVDAITRLLFAAMSQVVTAIHCC